MGAGYLQKAFREGIRKKAMRVSTVRWFAVSGFPDNDCQAWLQFRGRAPARMIVRRFEFEFEFEVDCR
jgi:hypothetical protein